MLQIYLAQALNYFSLTPVISLTFCFLIKSYPLSFWIKNITAEAIVNYEYFLVETSNKIPSSKYLPKN